MDQPTNRPEPFESAGQSPGEPLKCDWCGATTTSARRGGQPFTDWTFKQHLTQCRKRPKTAVSDSEKTVVSDSTVRSTVISKKSRSRQSDSTDDATTLLSNKKERGEEEEKKLAPDDTAQYGPGIDLPLALDRDRASKALAVCYPDDLNGFERSIVLQWIRGRKPLTDDQYEVLPGVLDKLSRILDDHEQREKAQASQAERDKRDNANLEAARQHDREIREARRECYESSMAMAEFDPFMAPPPRPRELNIHITLENYDEEWEREFGGNRIRVRQMIRDHWSKPRPRRKPPTTPKKDEPTTVKKDEPTGDGQ